MENIIYELIEYAREHGVIPTIRFEPDIGCMWIEVTFMKNNKAIDHTFYYTPCGDQTLHNFKNYNKYLEEQFNAMIEQLEED